MEVEKNQIGFVLNWVHQNKCFNTELGRVPSL